MPESVSGAGPRAGDPLLFAGGYQRTESTYAEPVKLALVTNSTPSSASGTLAFEGTCTEIVFH